MFNKLQKLILGFCILFTLLYGADNKTIKVSVTPIKTENIKQTLYLTGTTQPTQTARIASPSEGPVERCSVSCYVREGDKVSSKQPLLTIGNNNTSKAQLNSAKQAFKEQETELQRIKVLVEKGAVAESLLENTLSKYENAKANLIKAKEVLSDYSIKAPWNGIVSKVYVREGDYVVPRAPLVEMYDPSSIVVFFNVPEQYSMKLNKNLDLSITFDAYANETFTAKITRIYPQLDPKTHMRAVEAKIVKNIKLIPQMFTRIKLTMNTIKDALSIPSIAILKDKKNKPYVFIVKENKIIKQNIVLGFEVDGKVLVSKGLSKNDKVVTAGFRGLKDGVEVSIISNKKIR